MKRCQCLRLTLTLAVLGLTVFSRPAKADPEPDKNRTGTDKRLEEFAYATLKRTNKLSHPKLEISLSISGVEGKTLLAPVMEHRSPDGKVDGVMYAKEGKLRVDSSRNVLIIELKDATWESDEARLEAKRVNREVKLPADFDKQ